MSSSVQEATFPVATWSFLTNHSHVLICLARDPFVRVRDVATAVGTTERAVQRIIVDLEEAGMLTHLRDGRRNRYEIHRSFPLPHPVEAGCTVGDLLAMVSTVAHSPRSGEGESPSQD